MKSFSTSSGAGNSPALHRKLGTGGTDGSIDGSADEGTDGCTNRVAEEGTLLIFTDSASTPKQSINCNFEWFFCHFNTYLVVFI